MPDASRFLILRANEKVRQANSHRAGAETGAGSHLEPLTVRLGAIHRTLMSVASRDVVLVAGIAVLLGGVSLCLAGLAADAVAPLRPRTDVARHISCCAPTPADHNLPPPFAPLRVQSDGVILPPIRTTGPWASPLYPQNGITLWDRIRASSETDPQAFLIGAAIQVHAPQTAATPGPGVKRPSCTMVAEQRKQCG